MPNNILVYYLLLFVIALAFILIALFILMNLRQKKLVKDLEILTRQSLTEHFLNVSDRIDSKLSNVENRNSDLERALINSFSSFQNGITQSMISQFSAIQETMESRLRAVDIKVNESLNEGFKKTNDTFMNIVERLGKIDEAQKKIDALSTDIISLQDVLTDKKTRGIFGEIQLNTILSSIFGEKNSKIYALQYAFNNGSRVDAVLFAPQPLGTVAIDSKFPLENYRKMTETSINQESRKEATRLFVSDCKRHIEAIASKYIIPTETSDQAIMFVPAEAIFATINAYHPEILDYAQRKRVWIASPTTLMSTLTMIQTILVNMEREKYANVIHQHLQALSTEFTRYHQRFESLSKKMDSVSDDFRKISITSNKITKRFEEISNVEIHGSIETDL